MKKPFDIVVRSDRTCGMAAPGGDPEETGDLSDDRDRLVRRDPRSRYSSPFALMDRVHIDGDTSLRGHVTALCWRSEDDHTVEVSWMHNGVSYAAWFQAWRLTLVDAV